MNDGDDFFYKSGIQKSRGHVELALNQLLGAAASQNRQEIKTNREISPFEWATNAVSNFNVHNDDLN